MATVVRGKVETNRAYWTFITPAFALYLFVFAFPIILSFVLSVSNYSGGKMFGGDPWTLTGFDQYFKLANDSNFWLALKNNVYIVLISVFGQIPLAFLLAYVIFRKIVRWGEGWQAILYVPAIISVIVLGIMWKMIFASNGLLADIINALDTQTFLASLNGLLAGGFNVTDDFVQKLLAISDPRALTGFANPANDVKELILSMGYTAANLDVFRSDMVNLLAPKWTPDFLSHQDVAMIPILFVTLWVWTGMYIIMFHANMQKIDSQIIEAARIDGASELQVMWRVIVPNLSGVLANAAILCIAGSLNTFALIWAMTAGGPMNITQVLAIYMFQNAFIGVPNFPLANAISVFIVLFSFILIGLTLVVERRYGGRE
ncbi:MAG: sugar ABC transporter permease [Spirochaetales bacterium]